MAVDFQKVKDIIVKQLNIDESLVTHDASFVDDLGADSIDTVELIIAFETEFGIDIPEKDQEKLLKVDDVIKYIESKI